MATHFRIFVLQLLTATLIMLGGCQTICLHGQEEKKNRTSQLHFSPAHLKISELSQVTFLCPHINKEWHSILKIYIYIYFESKRDIQREREEIERDGLNGQSFSGYTQVGSWIRSGVAGT